MKSVEKSYIKLRTIIVGVIFSLFLGIIGSKAVYLQVYQGSWLSQRAAKQYEGSFRFHGKRGTIYDANHREMAVSTDVTSIAAYPPQISDLRAAENKLAKVLKLDKKILRNKLRSKKSFVWIKRKVTPKIANQLRELKIQGIDFITEHSRFYPNKTLAAQVLGFAGVDSHGLEGLEYHYDKYLRGATGKIKIFKDALGRGFDAQKDIKEDQVYSGNNLILTIDTTVQYITEEALEEAVQNFSAESGMAIVMAPKTGAVLALAHFPRFNPNKFLDYSRDLWRNRAITDPFEPGSTLKIFSAAAAIESGKCTPETTFFCENGEYKIGENIVHDTRPLGWLSLQQIIKYSSNIGAAKLSEKLGPESLYTHLRYFGFGEKTGIDCPGETSGNLLPHKKWSNIDMAAISFGQGISVSAIQLITAACAIANDGILMKPYIVQAVTNPNGRLIKNFGPVRVKRSASIETAGAVRHIMKSVIDEGGTGVNARLEGYTACGKTGTAQKTDESGTYANENYMASFIGFAPAKKPVVAILVVIDEPRLNHYGGVVAAPVFKKIASATLNYMNVPPTTDTDRFTVGLSLEVRG
jgi:cell division protein FtsI (penicillin-binding protein 3)